VVRADCRDRGCGMTKMLIERSRAEKAGEATARAIIEMVHLMYQRNTAKNFWRGLKNELQDDKSTGIGDAL